MKLHFHGERVLAVVAHPDDAELLCAGTLARAKHDGAAIGICYLCQGDKGQPAVPIEDLAGTRRHEAQSAATLLGAELFAGVFSDGSLADEEVARAHLLRVYRMFRPTLLMAHAPNDYHPDHRAAAAVAEAASWYSASRGQVTDGLEPLTQPPSLWWMDTLGMTGFEPAIYIDVSNYAELKLGLLQCHESQLARSKDRDFHPLRDLMSEQMQTRGREAGVAAAEAFRPYLTFKRTRAW